MLMLNKQLDHIGFKLRRHKSGVFKVQVVYKVMRVYELTEGKKVEWEESQR